MSNKRHKHYFGFSLIEVLVALVVLGVGMLGIATLFITSMRANGSAISRMHAVNLASDMADRIRANRTAGASYSTSTGPTAANQSCSDPAATAPTVDVVCSVANMASHDRFIWNAQITSLLPGTPTGTIAVVAGTGFNTYTITVNWTEPNSGALSYALTFQI